MTAPTSLGNRNFSVPLQLHGQFNPKKSTQIEILLFRVLHINLKIHTNFALYLITLPPPSLTSHIHFLKQYFPLTHSNLHGELYIFLPLSLSKVRTKIKVKRNAKVISIELSSLRDIIKIFVGVNAIGILFLKKRISFQIIL